MPEKRYNDSVYPGHHREIRRKRHEKDSSYHDSGSVHYGCPARPYILRERGRKASDQSKSPLIGAWIAQETGHSDYTFHADGTGYLQRGEIIEKITFADKGDGTFEMSTERVKTPIKSGYRIEGDTLYMIDPDLGIEDAYTRKP
ncbi:MAG: hypothetical protein IJK28_01475 [Clostridia bacterium]|nr:hypothetical protein [Clostridia bacterium]